MVQESNPPSEAAVNVSKSTGLRIKRGGRGVLERLDHALSATSDQNPSPSVSASAEASSEHQEDQTTDSVPMLTLDDFVGLEIKSFRIESHEQTIPFGSVFRAAHTTLKLSASVYALDVEQAIPDATYRDAYLRRLKEAQRLWHPHLIRILGVETLHPYLLIITENPDVMSVYDLIERDGGWPEERALNLVQDVAEVLALGCEKHLNHHEICPQHLFVTPVGQTKVIDFGWPIDGMVASPASLQDAALWTGGKRRLTPLWARSPERLMAVETSDYQSDIYALGVTLFFMLTGRPPYRASTIAGLLQEQEQPLLTPLQLNSSLTEVSSNLTLSMMGKEPTQRVVTYSDLLFQVKTALVKLQNMKMRERLQGSVG